MSGKNDLTTALASLHNRLDIERWVGALGNRPCESLLGLLGLATLVFYGAEKNRNPKVNDVWDALVYCSTSLSVGSTDIFAKTALGKIMGSALMTFGPSLAAKSSDGPRASPDVLQREILNALERILVELRCSGANKSDQTAEVSAN